MPTRFTAPVVHCPPNAEVMDISFVMFGTAGSQVSSAATRLLFDPRSMLETCGGPAPTKTPAETGTDCTGWTEVGLWAGPQPHCTPNVAVIDIVFVMFVHMYWVGNGGAVSVNAAYGLVTLRMDLFSNCRATSGGGCVYLTGVGARSAASDCCATECGASSGSFLHFTRRAAGISRRGSRYPTAGVVRACSSDPVPRGRSPGAT